jgi:predicted phage terminase large subunit-like protein
MTEPEKRLSDRAFLAARTRLEEEARSSFPVFLALCFPQNAGAPYKLEPFHLALADIVQGMSDGTLPPRNTVSAPPQHGKSRMLAVRAVAWILATHPGISIALTGFSRSLLVDFLAEVCDVVRLPAFQRIFGTVLPLSMHDRADSKVFSNGSSVLVRSAGSKLTGRRVDWLIVDDPHAGRAEAESAVQRRKVVQWFFADCLTRLSPGARVLLIGTRWHPHDLIGHLTSDEYNDQLRQEGQEDCMFHPIVFKALADEQNDPLGRAPGEPLAPSIRPLSFLLGMRATLIGYEWDSLYQGTPRSSAAGQTDVSKLRRCNASEVPKGLEETRGWDLAITESQTADYTAGVRLAYDPTTQLYYITDVYRQRMAWPKLRACILRISHSDRQERGIARIGIEAVSGFDAVYQDVRKELSGHVSVIKKNPPRGGKLMRAAKWLALLEAGRIVMVRGPWNHDFVAELEQFPDGEHDDQVDGTSIAFEMLENRERLLIA